MVRRIDLLFSFVIRSSFGFSLESIIGPSSALGICFGTFFGQSWSISSINLACSTESNGRISESSFARRTEKIETTKKGLFILFFWQTHISLLAPSTRLGTVQSETFVGSGVSSRERLTVQSSGHTRDRSISEEQSNVGQESTGRLSLQPKEHRDLRGIHQVRTNISIEEGSSALLSCRTFNFADIRIDEALRIYLSEFRLPGESPLISALLEHFAARWRVRSSMKRKQDLFPFV